MYTYTLLLLWCEYACQHAWEVWFRGRSGVWSSVACFIVFWGGGVHLVKVHPYPYIYMTGFCTFLESAFSVTFDS